MPLSLPFPHVLETTKQLFRRLTTIPSREPRISVGLDVGSSSIKVVALGARKGAGPRPLLGHQLVPLETGQDADASDPIRTAMTRLSVAHRAVNLSVSGQWVIMRIVEMPTMKPTEMHQALPFEAQRYLPFNIQDVVIDGVVLGPADANKTWVLIVACKRELLDRRIDWAKRAGVEVALIDVDALALVNAFLASGQRTEGTRTLVNVGAQLTNLVIFQGAIPYLVRDIPWGGDKLFRNVAEQMGAEVNDVQRELTQGAPNPDLLGAVKLASEALVTELQLSFDYFENRFGQPPEEVLVSGGMSQSGPFLEAMKSLLTQNVAAWMPAPDLSGQFAVAYGLALRSN